MFKMKVLPSGQEVDIEPETTLLEAFKRENIYIKATCGGYASCGNCRVKIVEGKENLEKSGFPELQLLGNVFHITKERLACQTTVTGDVTVDISVHEKDKIENKIVIKKPKPPKVTKPVVRKKEEVEKVKEERFKEYEAQKIESERWVNHWQKNTTEEGEIPKVKKLGGGRRPRPFQYKNDEVDFEKVKAEIRERHLDQGEFRDEPQDERFDTPDKDFRKKRQE